MFRQIVPQATWHRRLLPSLAYAINAYHYALTPGSVRPVFNTFHIAAQPASNFTWTLNHNMDQDQKTERNKRPRRPSSSDNDRSEKRQNQTGSSEKLQKDGQNQMDGSSFFLNLMNQFPSAGQEGASASHDEPSAASERVSHQWHSRKWIKDTRKSQRLSHQPGVKLSVMSYNILAQDLIYENEYLYSQADPDDLDWKRRRPALMKEIKHLSPDVICLQEVQQDHFNDQLKPAFKKLGYSALYKKRTGYKPDGCALLYRKSKFALEKSELVEFYMERNSLMDRDNVGIIAVFRVKSDEGVARVCVATTHILFNMKRGDVKLGQVCMLMAEIEKLMGTKPCPLILCGDFNCHPFSPLYNFVVLGHLPYEGLFADFIAGDSEYSKRSKRHRVLTRDCLPPPGIDEHCHYVKTKKNDEKVPEKESEGEKPPERSGNPEQNPASSEDFPELSAQLSAVELTAYGEPAGHIHHDFKLVSAYQHFTQRQGRYHPEITTYHGRASTTVDFVFYSVTSRNSRVQNGFLRVCDVVEGPLKLLERYDLLVPREAGNIGCLPTHQFGSDHFSLMCKFHLDFEIDKPKL